MDDQILNDLGIHYQKEVTNSIKKRYSLWVHGEINQDERQSVDEMWEQITQSGTSKIKHLGKVYGTDGELHDMPEEFATLHKEEINAQLARILSRPNGRRLIELIMGSKHEMKVTTPTPNHLVLDPSDRNARCGLDMKAVPESDIASSLQGSDYNPGQGSAFGISVPPGIKESDYSDFNARGKRIPSPKFVQLGHEMTHGVHYAFGTCSMKLPPSEEDDTKILPPEYFGDFEEFRTIHDKDTQIAILESFLRGPGKISEKQRGRINAYLSLLISEEHIPNEADIRKEHELPLRVGHTSTLSTRCEIT